MLPSKREKGTVLAVCQRHLYLSIQKPKPEVRRTKPLRAISNECLFTITQKDYLVRDSLFVCLPGDDLGFQGPAPQVLSALEVLTSVFGMGTGGTPPA